MWRVAQHLGVAATVLLLIGLLKWPEVSLEILWNVLIPLVPASLLITPALWRSVCPLATLNMYTNGLLGRRTLTKRMLPVAGTTGILLLVLLVPARRFLFNEHGTLLALVIVVVAVAALLLGAVFDAKAGFCNAICPVLPVEKLYGQHPMNALRNPRCSPCDICTAKGCIDLSPQKSIRRAVGPDLRPHAWLTSTYGVFAAAFPGFVLGYYTIADVPLARALEVYAHVLLYAGACYGLTAVVVRLTNTQAARALPVLAALAAGLYYWFAASALAATFGVAGVGTWLLRGAALLLIGVWLRQARINGQ